MEIQSLSGQLSDEMNINITSKESDVFIVDNAGDTSVGINGFCITCVLPNIGIDELEHQENCKAFLDELYNQETRGKVYTKKEYDELWNNELELEKIINLYE